MKKVRVVVAIVLGSLAALLYLGKENRKPHDRKDLNKEISRWEGEGGNIPDHVKPETNLQ
jgi:hypothetical protein